MSYPLVKFFFQVEIDGETIPFKEVSGLDQQLEFLEYRHGKMPSSITMKRAGIMKTSTVILKKGMFKSDSKVFRLFNRYNETAKKKYYGITEREHGLPLTVKLFDPKNSNPLITWEVSNAIPVKLSGADFKSDENSIAVEAIEFVHEGIEITFS